MLMQPRYLISLPPAMAPVFAELEGRTSAEWFAVADPEGPPPGSGGATAHLLVAAWRDSGTAASFASWLAADRRVVIHAGGQSRRLPAYAPVGKSLLPVPVLRWSRGQRLDQTLLDLQQPLWDRILRAAPENLRVLLGSGDAWIRPGTEELPALPEADVVALGIRVPPETAQHFGVLFCHRREPGRLAFAEQKPTAARIREMALQYRFAVDTGVWLLSARAVSILMRRCGWEESRETFRGGRPAPYEFYARFTAALGTEPRLDDPEIRALRCAVVEWAGAEFHHFGTSAQMLESVVTLQNRVPGDWEDRRHPDQVLQNARVVAPLDRERGHTLWIENSVIGARWCLTREHVLTGIPDNDWELALPPGICLDMIPVDDELWCIRPYGFADPFRGAWDDPRTVWMGRPLLQWLEQRRIPHHLPAWPAGLDIHNCPLFPLFRETDLDPAFVEWFWRPDSLGADHFARLWLRGPRLSAADLLRRCNARRLYGQRARLRREALRALRRNARWSVFYRLDLEATARLAVQTPPEPEPIRFGPEDPPLQAAREAMYQAALARLRNQRGWERREQEAFELLREMLVREARVLPVHPVRSVQEDQIVWARSPVRVDLAGGWTDTPPYCLEHGGRVLNLAVDLNGQPPLQVFAKCIPEPVVVIRSIDLSAEERVRTYAELENHTDPGSPFALARAALALAGFSPRFHAHGGFGSLEQQLREFGAGIELSLVAAVPKGSGLGTSSILAATLLAALSDLCGLGWDRETLSHRTLVLEQLLGTGGGWQDQLGAIERGIKLIETGPGLRQSPQIHWLPQHLFESPVPSACCLLYYTGITRLAWNILGEIVRAVFLNSPKHLALLEQIGQNARRGALAVQRCDFDALCETVRESWHLNQALDPATNPPPVRAILDTVAPDLAAAKLTGAGGGGYLFMIARDPAAAARIRETLTRHPPNPRARFVNFSISSTGLQVTRS